MIDLYSSFVLAFYCLSGLFVGYFLSHVSPEEMKPGRPYFNTGRNITITLIGLVSAIYLFQHIQSFIFVILFGVVLGIFLLPPFVIFGATIPLVGDNAYALIFASLTFIFGLFHTSLRYNKKLFAQSLLYFIIPFVVFLLLGYNYTINILYPTALLMGYALTYPFRHIQRKQ